MTEELEEILSEVKEKFKKANGGNVVPDDEVSEEKSIIKKVTRYLLIKLLWSFYLNKIIKVRDLYGEKR